MKKFSRFIFFSLIIFSTSQICANDYTASKAKGALIQNHSGWSGIGTASPTTGDIGLNISNNNDKETDRSEYGFDLSDIPTNAYISNVSISVSCSNNNSQFKYNITQLPGHLTDCYDIYEESATSPVIYEDVLYSATGTLATNNLLFSFVNNNKGGHIYLGLYSENEFSQGSYATINILLHVDVNLVTITADNNFSTADKHGKIDVTGYTGDQSAPFSFKYPIGQTATMIAVPNQTDIQGFQRIWATGPQIYNSFWRAYNSGGNIPITNNTNISYTTVNLTNNYDGVTFEAGLRKVYQVPVQNTFVGGITGGTIIVNGIQYPSGTAIPVDEQNAIIVTAQNQTYHGIDYTFTNWSDGIKTNPRTFYPTDNSAITAVFQGIPNIDNMQVQGNPGTRGTKPQLTWIDNVNLNVYYKIYRQFKVNGSWGNWIYACDVPKGRGQYVDQFYVQVQGTDYNLGLKVDAYYSTEATSRQGGWCLFDAGETFKQNFGNNNSPEITEYKLYDNFPNPFNPSTEIQYQVPNDGNVKLKVYNIMGQEVMTLVNGFKEKGMYSVSFNAGSLPSGVYIYKIEAGNYTQVKKMLLTK